MNYFDQIYSLVSQIPKGKVLTYKIIAQKLNIKNPRYIGLVLHRNKNPNKIPCHRVVKSSGQLAKGYAFGGINEQKIKLQKEGVLFISNYKVSLKECLFNI